MFSLYNIANLFNIQQKAELLLIWSKDTGIINSDIKSRMKFLSDDLIKERLSPMLTPSNAELVLWSQNKSGAIKLYRDRCVREGQVPPNLFDGRILFASYANNQNNVS